MLLVGAAAVRPRTLVLGFSFLTVTSPDAAPAGPLDGFWRDRSSTADVSPGRAIYLRGDGTDWAPAYLLRTPPEMAADTERVRRGARIE